MNPLRCFHFQRDFLLVSQKLGRRETPVLKVEKEVRYPFVGESRVELSQMVIPSELEKLEVGGLRKEVDDKKASQ